MKELLANSHLRSSMRSRAIALRLEVRSATPYQSCRKGLQVKRMDTLRHDWFAEQQRTLEGLQAEDENIGDIKSYLRIPDNALKKDNNREPRNPGHVQRPLLSRYGKHQ
jgi:hypothetical protein